jgi:hypothetical protein
MNVRIAWALLLAWWLYAPHAGAQAPASKSESASESESESESESASEPEPEPASVSEPEPEPEPATLGATARTIKPEQPGETRIPITEAREVPGAFGDPLRVLDALPGVAPIVSGLPYGYVRGAPPATVGYAYDDIPLPALYHFAFGPSVVHPRMLGALHFYPGVPPARYGRRLGGELAVDASPMPPVLGGEVELRLLDANGYLRVPVAGGALDAAVRYGYPGPLLRVISPDTTLSYWDYQSRLDLPIGDGARVQVIALGSYDELINPKSEENENRFGSVKLQFHRLELRLIKRFAHAELGTAVRLGVDQSSVDQDLSVDAFDVGPRVWLDAQASSTTRVRVGADLQGSTGSITSADISAPLQVAGRRQLRLDVPLIAEAAARSASGVYAELHWNPAKWTELELGARGDLWIVDGDPTAAFDPRARWTIYAGDRVALHVAAGMAHQPAAYLFPLPGLTEVALDRGVQESLQSEAGVAIELPWDLQLEAQFFAHHYARLLLPELYAPDEGEIAPRSDALSYGVETMLRREGRGDLTGWVSYTLAFADAQVEGGGAKFSPEFDIRHVLNVVLLQQLGAGFSLGGRLSLRSGRPFTQFDANAKPIYELRLPGFVRVDARFGYTWGTSWGAMQAYVEWLNLTISKEALGAECFYGACRLQYAPAIFFPNAGVRAQL